MTRTPDIVLDVLRRHALIDGDPGWRATLAPGGTTDRTFSVIDPRGAPVLTARIARPGFGAWLLREEAVLRELGSERTGWAPEGVRRIEDAALPEGQMLVHDHVGGEPVPLASLGTQALEALGACLAWVHGHPREGFMIWPSLEVRYGTRAACYHARLASLLQYAVDWGALPGVTTLVGRLEALDLHVAAGWGESAFALIHGDLSAGNILWRGEGQVTLIDWEFARDGDPAEDLAYLIAEQDLPVEVVADLADAYASASGDAWTLARMTAWLPLVALDAALWWADYLTRQGRPVADDAVEARLDRAQRYLGG